MASLDPGRARVRTGYVLNYRPGRDNACPGCGGSHWLVGRSTAECGFCATALPIVAPAWGVLTERRAA